MLDGGHHGVVRPSTSMTLTVELSSAQAERLRREAEHLGLAPEELARVAIADLIVSPDEEFKSRRIASGPRSPRPLPASGSRHPSLFTVPHVVISSLSFSLSNRQVLT